ncbi:hypothetical protein PRK78_003102 [Emydomyces testavorans]|uniref:Uncharacterized protein n=1 Tax=Emydomyces testavorans TaxID=2070801 RepID=A0AAF0DH42_9EURO|nr:hypothetical protein PRK78_003102 [Emydomyces testavorans]
MTACMSAARQLRKALETLNKAGIVNYGGLKCEKLYEEHSSSEYSNKDAKYKAHGWPLRQAMSL